MSEKIRKIIDKLYQSGRGFQRMLREACVSAHASSAAFFIFLSVIPMGMIVCSVIPYSNLVQQEIDTISQAIIPDQIYSFLKEVLQISEKQSITLVSVSAFIAIWSASKGVLALMRGLNFVYQIQESRGYFALRIRAMFYTLLLLLAIALSAGLLVFGNAAVEALTPRYLFVGGVWQWLGPLRHIVVACLIAVTFCTMYCLLPNNRLPWLRQLPGAVFTAVFWTIYSYVFSVYIDYGDAFSMYGSLTTVVIVMIWLYFCMYIFFCGALVNRFIDNHFELFEK